MMWVRRDVDKKKQDNRWWEFYFVRYFVGTALGAIIVLFLAISDSPICTDQDKLAKILKESFAISKIESGHIGALATLGLAFCYFASSPILVLHATRGALLKIRDHLDWCLIILFVLLTFVLAGAQSYPLWSALQIKGNPWVSDFYTGSIFLLVISAIFIGQLFLLWLSLSGREKNAFEYYDKLVAKRAKSNESGKEYIESYRHLREHGNAFFIVLLELLLGAALFYSTLPWAVILMLWIFPAVGVWFFGTFLENRDF